MASQDCRLIGSAFAAMIFLASSPVAAQPVSELDPLVSAETRDVVWCSALLLSESFWNADSGDWDDDYAVIGFELDIVAAERMAEDGLSSKKSDALLAQYSESAILLVGGMQEESGVDVEHESELTRCLEAAPGYLGEVGF